ncbi:hypothetical protein C0995_006660, partial [Termitomyces sp. Mi166
IPVNGPEKENSNETSDDMSIIDATHPIDASIDMPKESDGIVSTDSPSIMEGTAEGSPGVERHQRELNCGSEAMAATRDHNGQGSGSSMDERVFTDASHADDQEPEAVNGSDSEGLDSEDSGDDGMGTQKAEMSWDKRKPPTKKMALDAIWEIDTILHPPNTCPGNQNKRHGYKTPKINPWSQHCLEEIKTMLSFYTMENSPAKGKWTHASALATQAQRKKPGHACILCKHARDYIIGWKVPVKKYGSWIKSKIDDDNELANDIKLYLQQCRKYVSTHKIVKYLNQLEVQSKHGLTKTVSLSTAKWWMKKLGYQWVKNHKEQYVDGHECDDVVNYQKYIFTQVVLYRREDAFLNKG